MTTATTSRPILVLGATGKTGRRVAQRLTALGLPWRILAFDAPVDVLRERVRQRHAAGTDASEADVAVLQGQLAHRDALTDEEASHALRIDTRAPVDWAAWSSALPSSE